jgi:hypothetical protein
MKVQVNPPVSRPINFNLLIRYQKEVADLNYDNLNKVMTSFKIDVWKRVGEIEHIKVEINQGKKELSFENQEKQLN